MSDIPETDALIDEEPTPAEELAQGIIEVIDDFLTITPLTRMETAQALAIVNFGVLLSDDGDEDGEGEPDTDLGAGV